MKNPLDLRYLIGRNPLGMLHNSRLFFLFEHKINKFLQKAKVLEIENFYRCESRCLLLCHQRLSKEQKLTIIICRIAVDYDRIDSGTNLASPSFKRLGWVN